MFESEAITITSASTIVHPIHQPMPGPSASVTHAKVVPASGSVRLRNRYAAAISNIGTNDTSSTAGACTPTPLTATMKPSVAASEYAGAVEATPITTFERKPIAFFFRPLSSTRPVAGAPATGRAGAATVSVAIGLLLVGGAGARLS